MNAIIVINRRADKGRRNGNSGNKSAEGQRESRGRGRLHARGRHNVDFPTREHPVAYRGRPQGHDRQPLDGVRVHATR